MIIVIDVIWELEAKKRKFGCLDSAMKRCSNKEVFPKPVKFEQKRELCWFWSECREPRSVF